MTHPRVISPSEAAWQVLTDAAGTHDSVVKENGCLTWDRAASNVIGVVSNAKVDRLRGRQHCANVLGFEYFVTILSDSHNAGICFCFFVKYLDVHPCVGENLHGAGLFVVNLRVG